MDKLNLIGRTEAEQKEVERIELEKGSLWGTWDFMHIYIFTKKEFDLVKKARKILKKHKQKIQTVFA